MKIRPDNAVFVILSFEGPDQYSMAGGLGTRVNYLAEALAETGFETHLFFVGDPALPGIEFRKSDKYILHRWSQWISAYYPNGVYDGEDGKVADFAASAPAYIEREIARKAHLAGKWTIVLAEEWQTADALMILSDNLHKSGLRDRALFLWNANNVMSFHKMNWRRLSYVSTITAVSKFMKHLMWSYGLDPIVVPNGIPVQLFEPLEARAVKDMARALKSHKRDVSILKIGRFDPAKRWIMAVEAVAGLKKHGTKPLFLMRGGIEPHGAEVLEKAAAMGLSVLDISAKKPTPAQCIQLIETAGDADILNLNFFLPDEFVRLLYRCCDCVLANSGFEPFGLVGLEVMAAGGLAFTGTTGEDYVIPFVNAVSIESNDPEEMVSYLRYLHKTPEAVKRIKKEAQRTAAAYSWPRVVENLLCRLEYISGNR